jgi:hypothetical protein
VSGDEPGEASPRPAGSTGPGPLRLLVVILGVLLLQAAFVASYAGALHDPEPHDVPAAVVAPRALVDRLNASLGPATGLVRAFPSPSEAAARTAILDRAAYGAYVPGPNGTARLLVASGRSPASVELMSDVFREVAKATNARLTITDIAPVSASDTRGLSTFYLVIGWTVGGYLIAIALGLFTGMTPAGPRAAGTRLAVLAGYAAAAGLVGTLILVEGYHYLPGHTAELFGLGALTVFAVGVFTTALESLFGIIGGFLSIALFVVLGNPAAGGPWPMEMMNDPWRSIGGYIPNGAGLTALRQILYLHGHAIGGPLSVLAVYGAIGVVGVVALSLRGRPLFDLAGAT